MAPVPTQTVLAPSASSPLPSTSSISLMPFSLAHDGTARISTFFHPRPFEAAPSTSKGKEEGAGAHRQASFRGRRVVSSTLALPSGYRGLVYSTTAPLPPSQDVAADEEGGAAAAAEREDRAAKRAKRAAASAAALDAESPQNEVGDEAGAEGDASTVRRSPRKSTTAASSRARERAVRAAKDKARRKAAQDAAKNSGFSLDSDDDQATEQAAESVVEAPALVADNTAGMQIGPGPAVDAAELDPAALTASDEQTLAEGGLEGNEVDSRTEEAPIHLPPPPPLRTLSTVSTASSSIITSTPRTTSPVSLTPKEEVPVGLETSAPLAQQDGPVTLARDEKRLVPCLTFDRIEVWNPDWPLAGAKVAEDDEVGRAITEWIGLAARIHAY